MLVQIQLSIIINFSWNAFPPILLIWLLYPDPFCFWVFLTHSWTSDCISDNLNAVHFHSCSDICPPGPHTKYLPSFRLLGSKPLPDQIINICNIISSVRMDLGREMSTGIYLCLGISLLQASVFFFFASADLQFPVSLPMCHSSIS